MTDRQLYGFFAIRYEDDGVTPKFENPFAAALDGLTPESVFKKYLWKIGIMDAAKQEELWKAERARRTRNTDAAFRPPPDGCDGVV